MAAQLDLVDASSSLDNDTPGESPLKLAATLSRSQQFPWYQQSFGSLFTPECRQLLERYSRIAPAEVESHVYKMRDVAWAIFPFPCIGEFWFLTLGLSNHPKYNQLLARMKSVGSPQAPTLIDLGTCFGQDLRKLAHDGVSPTQLLGVDVFSAFEKIGQDFFQDEDRFSGRFRTADVFAVDSALTTELQHSQDIVTATMFLHSFDWPTQVLACKKMVGLARGGGSWLMGAVSGSTQAGEHWLKPPFVPEGVKKNVYRHSTDSFIRMWTEVGSELGIKLDIFAEYESGNTAARRATEQGGVNFFVGLEQKLLWYRVEIVED